MKTVKSGRLWLSLGLCALGAAAGAAGWATLRAHGQALPAVPVTAGDLDLTRHLQIDPSDHRAWAIKARLDARAERFEAAAAAYASALSGRSKVARDPDVWVEYAEALALSRGGKLAGEPLQHVYKALSLRPDHAGALDLAASAAWDAGDFDLAAAHWKHLLGQLPASDPRRAGVRAAIERARRQAQFALPQRVADRAP